jgi:hypothetical protein
MQAQYTFDGHRVGGCQKLVVRVKWYGVGVLVVITFPFWPLEQRGHAQDQHELRRPASNDSHSWHPLGMGAGGAMFTPAISPADPKRILVSCDMSGVYRSDDGGKSWEMIHYRQLSDSTKVRPH